MDIDKVIARVKKFSENIGKTIAQQSDDIKKARLFGLLFSTLPNYDDLCFRNQKTPQFTGVNPVLNLLSDNNFPLVNSWGEIWKTFEDIDVRLVELGIDEIMEGDDV